MKAISLTSYNQLSGLFNGNHVLIKWLLIALLTVFMNGELWAQSVIHQQPAATAVQQQTGGITIQYHIGAGPMKTLQAPGAVLTTNLQQPVYRFFRDQDQDGRGNRFQWVLDYVPPVGFIADSTDCDDANPGIGNVLAGNFFPQDTLVTSGTQFVLRGPAGFQSYSWNTGATDSFITITSNNASRWFRLTVISSGGCQSTDSVFVRFWNAGIQQNDTTICGGTPITLNAFGSSTTAVSVCGTATNEGQFFVMQAPVGFVFQRVVFASYGTPNGNCGNFSLGTCHATSSQLQIEQRLLNRNSATITQDWQIFGDPCIGTSKRLYVEAQYDVPGGGGRFLWSTGDTTPTITVRPAVSTTYYCTITSEGRTITDSVRVNVTPLAVVNAGIDQSYCLASASPLSLTATGGSAGTWARISGPGAPTITTPSAFTTSVTGLQAGNHSFRWTVLNPGCPSSFDDVNVQVSASPSVSEAGPWARLCNANEHFLSATLPTVGNGLWSLESGPSTNISIANPSSASSRVSGLVANASVPYIFRWTVTNGTCPASIDTVHVWNLPGANPGTISGPSQVCTGSAATLTLSGNAGAILRWETALPGENTWSTIAHTSSNYTTPALTQGRDYRVVVQSAGLCNSVNGPRFSVGINTVTTIGTLTGAASTVCSGINGDTLRLSTGNGALVRWESAVSPFTSWATVSGQLNMTLVWSNLTQTTRYRAVVRNGACSEVTSPGVEITVLPATSNANAGPDQNYCLTSAAPVTLTATSITVGTGAWTRVSGPGTMTINSPSAATTTLSGLQAGSHTFRWTVTGNNCPAKSDEVTISVFAAPSQAEAGPWAQLCSQTSHTLSATSPINGSGQWSLVSGPSTSGIAFSATSQTNAVVTGLQTSSSQPYVFRWTVSNGNCAATSDTVHVWNLPGVNPGVISGTNSICSGSSTTLTVTGNAGPVVRWETSVATTNSWSPVANTTSTLTTGVLNQSMDYRVIVQGSGQCSAIVGPTYRVTVSAPTVAGSISGATTVCAGNNSGSISLSNQVGNVVRWESSLAPFTTWSTVSGQINSSLSYQNLSQTIRFRAIIRSGACSDQTSAEAIVQVNPALSLANAGIDQNYCLSAATPVTLSATALVNGTGTWTRVSGPATVTISNPSSHTTTVTGLQAGIHSFRWAVSDAVCAGNSDTVQITVFEAPAVAEAGNSIQLCNQASTTLNAAAPNVGTGRWSVVSGPGGSVTFVNETLRNTVVNGLITSLTTPYVLRWRITNGTCTTEDTVHVWNFPTTVAGVISGSNAVCANTSNTLTLTGNTGAIIRWESTPTGQGQWTPIAHTANSLVIPTQSQNLEYRVVVQSGGACSTVISAAFAVAGSPVSVAGLLSGSTTDCPGSNGGTISLSGQVGNILRWERSVSPFTSWTSVSTSGSASFNWSGLSQTTRYRAVVRSGVCPEVISNEAIIQIISNPSLSVANAGPDQDYCVESLDSLFLNASAVTTGVGTWTRVSGPGTPQITNTALRNTSVSGLLAGVHVFRWTVSAGICAANTDDVSIRVFNAPSLADAGPTAQLCNVTTHTLSAIQPAIGRGRWSLVSGPTATVTFANDTVRNTTISGLQTSLTQPYVLRWTVTNGPCLSTTDTVHVWNYPVTNPGVLTGINSLCTGNSTTLTLAGNTGTVLRWESSPRNANTWAAIDHIANSLTTGFLTNSTDFRVVVQSGGVCSIVNGPTYSVTVDANTVSGTIGGTTAVCSSTNTVSLQVSGNTGSVIRWERSVSPFTNWSIESGATSTSLNLTNLSQTTRFRVTVRNGACTEAVTPEFTVQFNPPLSASNAGPDQTVCEGNSVQLSATPVTSGIGTWQRSSGPGLASIQSPASPSTLVTGLAPGIHLFSWVVSGGGCQPNVDEVRITVIGNPSTAEAGPSAQLCNQTIHTLNANAALIGTGRWSLLSGPSAVSFSNDANPNSNVSGLVSSSVQPYIFRWTVSNNPCLASIDTVHVWNLPASNPGSISGQNAICAGSAVSLTLSGNAGNVIRWESSPAGTNNWMSLAGTTNTLNTGSLSQSTDYRVVVQSGGVCNVVTGAAFTIQVSPVTQGGAVLGSTNVCSGTNSATLQASGFVGNILRWEWSVSPFTTWNADANLTASSTVWNNITQTTRFRVVVRSGVCSEATSTFATIQVNPPLSTANAGPDQSYCLSSPSPLTLTAGSISVGTGLWSRISGPGTVNIQQPAQLSTAVSGLSAGTHVFRWTVSGPDCPNNIDDVSVTVFEAPSQAEAGSDAQLCNQVSYTLNASEPSVGVGSWSLVSGPSTISFSNPLSRNTLISGLQASATQPYRLRWAISNGSCTVSSDTVLIWNFPTTVAGVISGSNSVCSGTNPTLVLSGNTGNVIRWESSVAGLNAWIPIANASTTYVATGLIQHTDFRAIVQSGGVCTQVSSPSFRVDLSPTTIGGSLSGATTVCAGQNSGLISLAGQTGSVVRWEQATAPFSNWIIVSTSASPNYTWSNLTQTTRFRAVVKSGVCPEQASAPVEIQVQVPPVLPPANAGPDFEYCLTSSQPLRLNATPVTVGIGTWLQVSGPVNVSLQDQHAPNTQLVGLLPGTYVFRWSVSSGVCIANTDEVQVRVIPAPSTAFAGNDTSLCNQSGFMLQAASPSVGRGRWRLISGPVTSILFGNDSLAATLVSGLVASFNQPYVFEWRVDNGSCTSSLDTIVFWNYPASVAGLISGDTSVCSGSSVSLSLSGNTGQILRWEMAPVGTNNWTFTQQSTATFVSSALTQGVDFRVIVQSNAVCPTVISPVYRVAVNAPTVAGLLTGSDTVCAGNNSGTISLTGQTGNVVRWERSISPFTNWVNEANQNLTSISWNSLNQTTRFRAVVRNGVCPEEISNPVEITIDAIPTSAFAGNDTQYCASTSAIQLNASAISMGQGLWTRISGPGVATIAAPNQHNTSVQGLQSGIHRFVWRVTNGVCASYVDTMEVRMFSPPVMAEAGPFAQLCNQSVVTLNATSPIIGSGKWTLRSGPSQVVSFSNDTLRNTVVSGLISSTTLPYVFQWTVSNGPCTSVFDTVHVWNYPASRDTTFLNASICQGQSFGFGNQTLTAAGVYIRNVPTVFGCDSIVSLRLLIRQPSVNTISQAICQGGSFLFGSQSLTSSGTYTRTIPNAQGCDSTITLILVVNQPSFNTIQGRTCPNQPYNFNGRLLTVAGTYRDTLVNARGCDSIVTLQLQRFAPTITFTSSTNQFCSGTFIQFNAGVSESVNNLTFRFFRNQQLVQAGTSATWSFNTPAVNDVIRVEAVFVNACGFNDTLVSTSIPLLLRNDCFPSVNTIAQSSICRNTNLQLTINPGGQTYQASNVFTVQLSNNSGSFANPTNVGTLNSATGGTLSVFINAPAGTGYRFRVLSSAPAITGPISNFALTIHEAPIAAQATITPSGSTTFCTGSFRTLSVPNTPGFTYAWQRNLTFIAGANQSSFNANIAGNYRVLVYGPQGCLLASNTVALTEVANPAVTAIAASTPTTLCGNDTARIAATSSTAGLSLQWTLNQVPIPGQTSAAIQTQNSGQYRLVATNSNGCSSVSTPINLSFTTPLLPTVSVQPNSINLCAGDSLRLTATSQTNATQLTFAWLVNQQVVQTTSQPTVALTQLPAGTHAIGVRMTSIGGCVSQPTVNAPLVNVVVQPNLVPSVVISGPDTVNSCQGSPINLVAVPTNGGTQPTYRFLLNGQVVQQGNSSVYSSSNWSNGDRLEVSMTSSLQCVVPRQVVSNPVRIQIQNRVNPTVALQLSKAAVCGAEGLWLKANASAQYPGSSWSFHLAGRQFQAIGPDSLWVSNLDSLLLPGQVLQQIPVTATYQIAGNNHCILSNSVSSTVQNLTLNAVPRIGLVSNYSGPVCTNDTLALQVVDSSGLSANGTFSWLQNGQLLLNATSGTLLTTSSGLYTAIVVSAAGCADTSTVREVQFVACNPQLTASNPAVCIPASLPYQVQIPVNNRLGRQVNLRLLLSDSSGSFSNSSVLDSMSLLLNQSPLVLNRQVLIPSGFPSGTNYQLRAVLAEAIPEQSAGLPLRISEALPTAVPLCFVTSNAGGNAQITWPIEPVYRMADSVEIFREGYLAGDFRKIGSAPYRQPAGFIDIQADLTERAHLYRITASNACGTTAPSAPHTTMHLSINQGNAPEKWNLLWNGYEGVFHRMYYLYRGTHPANMMLIDSVPARSWNTYTDVAPVQQGYLYQVAVADAAPCTQIMRTTKVLQAPIRSNMVNNGLGRFSQAPGLKLELWPNPQTQGLSSQLMLLGAQEGTAYSMRVYSAQGQLLQERMIQGDMPYPLQAPLASGVYWIRVQDQQGHEAITKWVIQR